MLLFIFVVPLLITIVILMLQSIVVIFKNLQTLCSLYFIITNEVTMVQWNQGKNLIHFLFAVVSVHVFCCYFEFLPQIVFDDPIASYRQQTYWLCNFAEQIVIYHDCALLNLLSFDFWGFYIFFSFDSGGRMLISENIIFFLTLIAGLIFTFVFRLFIEIFFEHVIIFNYLRCNLLLIIIYFSHET